MSEGERENRLSILIENGLWEGRLRPNDRTNHHDRSQASFLVQQKPQNDKREARMRRH